MDKVASVEGPLCGTQIDVSLKSSVLAVSTHAAQHLFLPAADTRWGKWVMGIQCVRGRPGFGAHLDSLGRCGHCGFRLRGAGPISPHNHS